MKKYFFNGNETFVQDGCRYDYEGLRLIENFVLIKQIEKNPEYPWVNDPTDEICGGWIESERNLSHEGDAWITRDATAFGSALVEKNAILIDMATIKDNSIVTDNAVVGGEMDICGKIKISGNTKISGDIYIFGEFEIKNNKLIIALTRHNKYSKKNYRFKKGTVKKPFNK